MQNKIKKAGVPYKQLYLIHSVPRDRQARDERCYSPDRRRREAAARGVPAVPGAGPHHADAEAGQDPPRQGLPRHLREHRVQPPPPRPLPRRRRRRRRGPPGVPLRHHPRRPAGVRRRRDAGPGVHQLLHQAQLPRSLEKPSRRARRRDVRRGGQPDELQRGRRGGDGRAVRALLDGQRLRLHGLPQLPPPHRQGHHPLQRRRAADERVHGHGGGLGARHEQAHAAQGLPELPPHHGPRRRAPDVPAARGGELGDRGGRHPQHLRRAGAAGAGLHARHHPGRVHDRPARVRRRAGRPQGRRPGRGELRPVERRPRLRGVAGRQGTPFGGVRELRERDGDERAGAGGVRVGAGEQRPRLPVGRQAGRGEGHGLVVGGRAAPGFPGGDRGQGPPGELVRPGGGAAARGGGALPDAQRVELDGGEPQRRGADAVLALLRGAADQLPVQVRRVGRGHGGRRRRAPGGRGGEDTGGHGRGQGQGDGEQGGGVEGRRRAGDGGVAREPRRTHQRRAAVRHEAGSNLDGLKLASSMMDASLKLMVVF